MAISKDDLNKAKANAIPTAANVVGPDLKGAIQRPNTEPVGKTTSANLLKPSQIKSSGEDTGLPSAQSSQNRQQNQSLLELLDGNIRPNALKQFATFNYIIELQATSIIKQQNFQTSEDYVAADWKTLISSAGGTRGVGALDESDKRKWFTKEYYLDDLEFNSIVGVTNNARATADLTVNFNIIEPYGINFIQELWEYNSLVLNCANWSETSYLLKITFKGYTDRGELQQSEIVKYLPIKIINIEVKLTESGSVYAVSGYVFNSQATDKVYGVLNQKTQCEGKTVSDIILGADGKTDSLDNLGNSDVLLGETNVQLQQLTIIDGSGNLKKSLNNFVVSEAARNKSPDTLSAVTQYDFKFVGELGQQIANSEISDQIDPKDTPMELPEDSIEANMLRNLKSYQFLGQRNSSTIKINIEKQKVNFNAGLITEILSQIIINSTYITDQIKNFRKNYLDAMADKNPSSRASKLEALKAPFNWFRIVPKVYDTGIYDAVSNRYQKRIVYQILGYTISNTVSVGGSLVPSEKQSAIESRVLKEYNYFFTGKNSEIISLDINLNTNYWNYRPRNPRIIEQATGAKPGDKPNGNQSSSGYGYTLNPTDLKAVRDPINSTITYVAASPERAVYGMGLATPDRVLAGQVASSIYNNVTQLVVEMEIMGDPDLFKQDGVYKVLTQPDDQVPIIFDNQEQYVRITFTNPRDINDSTGTLESGNQKESVFSGLYVIIQINNMFKQGKFTQQMTLRRAANNVDDQPELIAKVQDEAGRSGEIINASALPSVYNS